jgi:hypothetical protein
MVAADRAYEDTGGYNGERRLWRAVLAAMCQDAIGAVDPIPKLERSHYTAAAHAWLRSESVDDVCDLAGMDPDVMKEGLRRKLDA